MLTPPSENVPEPYIVALTRFAEVGGRSSPREYWSFVIVNAIVMLGIELCEQAFHPFMASPHLLSRIFGLLSAVPTFSVGFRRMHDIGRNGFWSLVPLVGVLMALKSGEPGENQYGVNPLDEV